MMSQTALTGNKYGLTFHHLGLAAALPDMAMSVLRGMGYEIGATVFDPLQNVNLALCDHARMPAIEIIFKAQGPSPLDRLLNRHKEGLVYHMCYATRDMEATLRGFEADGVRVVCVTGPKPAVLLGGRSVSFYQVLGVGLVEIIDESGHAVK
jgi:methylmalonyl-CoA/ethylmalonyl-CoA epimerase